MRSRSGVGFETATAPPPPLDDGERLKRAKVVAQIPTYVLHALQPALDVRGPLPHPHSRADVTWFVVVLQGYPYPRPDSSFVYINGQTYEFDDSQWLGAGGLEWLKTNTPQGHLR